MSYWGLNRGQDIQGLCVSPPSTSFSNLKGFRPKNLCLSEVTELLWSEHRERKDCPNTSQKPREFWITFDKQPASCSLLFSRTLPQDNVYIESKNGNIKHRFVFLFFTLALIHFLPVPWEISFPLSFSFLIIFPCNYFFCYCVNIYLISLFLFYHLSLPISCFM